MKKNKQRLPDLPIKYVKIGRTKWWLDSVTGEKVHDDLIHTKCKGYLETKDELIREKRYDLKYD